MHCSPTSSVSIHACLSISCQNIQVHTQYLPIIIYHTFSNSQTHKCHASKYIHMYVPPTTTYQQRIYIANFQYFFLHTSPPTLQSYVIMEHTLYVCVVDGTYISFYSNNNIFYVCVCVQEYMTYV